jgi:prolyl-tRNA editing enzyme YbaK/EbsC (Cys-tRNA(Pro) deacylase)
VATALRTAGVRGEVRELAASTRTAAEAAAALGCPVEAIANSLVFIADGAPVLVLARGGERVDLDRLARAAGATEVRRATPDEVRAATGQPIGGVAPVGHPARLRTFVDRSLARTPVLWAAAGTPHAVFATTYAELLRLTGGVAAQLQPPPR